MYNDVVGKVDIILRHWVTETALFLLELAVISSRSNA
jgi:hypothetical protein